MARTLIIGYGNRFRSDDGLGIHAAEELSRVLSASDFEVLALHQLTPELAETISQAELVLLIDAGRQGRPGEVRCTPVNSHRSEVPFTHQLTPEILLSLCWDLYGVRTQAFEISVCGECFDLGEELSPSVAKALPVLVDFVRNFGAEPAASIGANSVSPAEIERWPS
jgi:hydrogenase maturation protease